MGEKILQAVVLTFLLKIIMGMNSGSAIQRHLIIPSHLTSMPTVSLLQRLTQ